VWGCERFWLYLMGKPFVLVTDNRAIQLIFGNAAKRPPARIERLGLRLTQFDYTIQHRPGASNIADYFSRHPCENASEVIQSENQHLELYINRIVESNLPPAVTRDEVRRATLADPELMMLAKFIKQENVQLPAALNAYKPVVDEISETSDGIMLRGDRMIIPASLHAKVVNIAHSGHRGIVNTKALIRSHVWFSGIDRMVEQKVQECPLCQATSSKQTYEPLRPSSMPNGPWERVSGDFFGPMDDGTFYFVNIDEYSRNVFVKNIKSVGEVHAIPVLEELFSTYGSPKEYKTDNGAPFNGYKFENFARKYGFTHKLITPYWPRANGEAERFMKNLGSVVRQASLSGLDKDIVLQEFLRAYRATPHGTTKQSPNMLMFGFDRTSWLPGRVLTASEMLVEREKAHKSAIENDRLAKKRMELEYNSRMKVRESEIKIGMRVLFKLKRMRKSDPAWDPNPYVVVGVKGSMITAARADRVTTRNSSFFKVYLSSSVSLPDQMVDTQKEIQQSDKPVFVELPQAVVVTPPVRIETPKVAVIPLKPVDVPAVDENLPGPAETPTAVVNPPVVVTHKRGRPNRQETLDRAAQDKVEYERKRALNPPERVMTRNRGGQ
jgi:transposase InsO family protein